MNGVWWAGRGGGGGEIGLGGGNGENEFDGIGITLMVSGAMVMGRWLAEAATRGSKRAMRASYLGSSSNCMLIAASQ